MSERDVNALFDVLLDEKIKDDEPGNLLRERTAITLARIMCLELCKIRDALETIAQTGLLERHGR